MCIATMKAIRGNVLLMGFIWSYISTWIGWIYVLAQVDPYCDFRYQLQFGEQQILQSPNFDRGGVYGAGMRCRWSYESPPGTVFDIYCDPINIPSSNQCYQDRLIVSRSGSPTFADGQNYCGSGTVQLTSHSNYLTIGLISAAYSRGGRYRCYITPIVQGGQTTPRPNTCDCGWRQKKRIIGGVETDVNEFPFMAALISVERRALLCGASIISNRYAITAAHCVDQQHLSQFALLAGDHNIAQSNDTNAAALYPIEDFVMHQAYNSRTFENDIAIIRTTREIIFSLNVGPICLPYRYTDLDFTDAPVMALGWGVTEFSGPPSDYLQKVNLTVVSQQTCQASYRDREIYSTTVCTYGQNKDACTFDSGGPIVWFDDFNTQRYQLLGAISLGRSCATSAPGINTRVPSYVSWIINQTPDAAYCFK